ncbi:MAG: TolC family outer membrane protein, partial [Propionivibrio sp.]
MRLNSSATRLSLLLGLLIGAAPVPAFSVDIVQIYREALGNDAQYAAARAAAEAGREKLPQGRAGLLPTIGGSANTVWNDNRYRPENSPTVSRDFSTHAYNLNLTQPLFRWQNFVQYDQSKLQVAQTEANFAQASQDLILRVAQAYFDVLYAQEALRAVRANKEAIGLQLEQAKKYFEVGTATITDSQEAQSRYDLAVAQEIAAENDLQVRRYALHVIVGRDAGELDRLKPEAQLEPPQPAALAPWVDAAALDSFVVQAQQLAAEIAAKEIDRMRAGHYPTLDAVANYGQNRAPQGLSSAMDTNSANIGLQLNIPIYQGGFINSKTREAVANRTAAEAALDSARRAATLNSRQSFLGVVNGLAQINALEAALISSRSALESNKLGYEVGVRINIDVLNAQSQL